MKLPKDVVADPRHDAVVSLLGTNTHMLWEKGANPVSTIPMNLKLAGALQRAFSLNQAIQGLEQITKEMAFEQKGLDAVIEKTAADRPQQPRISRLLFMSNDGSERFYRDCDSLLSKYGQRLLGCRIDLSGEDFGVAIFSAPKLVRAALITDKKAVAQALLALLN